MKNILCVCNTYFQLLTAIQLKQTLYANNKMSVYVSDHSSSVENVVATLQKETLFERVLFFQTKGFDDATRTPVKRMKAVASGIFGVSKLHQSLQDETVYDELLYFNQGMIIEILFACLYKRNPNLYCARFEEGILSYNHVQKRETFANCDSKQVQMLFLARKVLGKKSLMDRVEHFFCFYPSLYHGELSPLAIPLFDSNDQSFKELLMRVFSLDKHALQYKQRYIFFASVGDFEGGTPIGEVALAKEIATYVGRDNLIVKVHPRDTTNSFQSAGLLVDENSSVPWEVIQLSCDFTKHVFLTASSGSPLTISMIMSKSPKVRFLYPMCRWKENSLLRDYIPFVSEQLEWIQKNLGCDIKVLSDLEDALL